MGTFPKYLITAIRTVEKHLREFYDLSTDTDVVSHLVDRKQLTNLVPELSATDLQKRACLLTVEERDETFVGVYFSDQVVERFESADCIDSLSGQSLDPLCVLIEEISHFHLMMNRYQFQRSVSQLELEWQAEVDKFLVSAAMLNQQYRNPHFNQLFSLLYENCLVTDSANCFRYNEANHHAARFWRGVLQQYRHPFHDQYLSHLKQVLREGYQSGWQGKIALVESLNIIAA